MYLHHLLLLIATSLAFGTCRAAEPPQHPDAIANTHPSGKVDIPGNLKYCVKRPKQLKGIVIDETDAELIGAWQYSTHTPPYVGYGYLHDQKSGKGEKKVIYRFQVKSTGLYDVRVSHCYNIRRSTSTPILVNHAEGMTRLTINQQAVPEINRLWKPVGSYPFLRGKEYSIVISNEGTEGLYVIADAIHLVPKRKQPD